MKPSVTPLSGNLAKDLGGAALVDSHAHLALDPLASNPEAVMARARAAGVKAVVSVGIDLEDTRKTLAIAEGLSGVYASIGVHPHSAVEATDEVLSAMEALAAHPKVVGYGEIGLDFFRNLSPADRQRAAFADQIAMAKRLRKPVVIHLRDAYQEGLDTLEKAAPFAAGGVIHCFSGNGADADRALALGFYISIPGVVTFKKNEELRKIVRGLPEDRILLETDCPFLAPEPLRGKDNEPAYMVLTAAKVAEVRNESLERIARVTTENAERIFGFTV